MSVGAPEVAVSSGVLSGWEAGVEKQALGQQWYSASQVTFGAVSNYLTNASAAAFLLHSNFETSRSRSRKCQKSRISTTPSPTNWSLRDHSCFGRSSRSSKFTSRMAAAPAVQPSPRLALHFRCEFTLPMLATNAADNLNSEIYDGEISTAAFDDCISRRRESV